MCGAARAGPPLRSPQVGVQGGALQAYFVTQGEHLDVNADQIALQSWPLAMFSACSSSSTLPLTLQVEVAGNAGHDAFGLYSSGLASPPLYTIFPITATNGWFATLSFRSSPARLLVSLFDGNATFQGTTVYPGVDRSDVGFFAQTPQGTFYTQDARNPAGDAQALAFAGTGFNSGSMWLCWEDDPLQSSGHDFADCLLFFEAPSDCPTPVETTTWSRLKGRFR